MCGICGIIQRDVDRPVDRNVLRLINQTMSHRGPDEQWYHLEPGSGLAMCRLAYNYPCGQQQTIGNESETILVLFDGEIYNRTELRGRLLSDGHILRTSCDAEILAHVYEEEGDNFPELLNGIFAIALWDWASRRLLLVRDRLGVKPLYIAHKSGSLMFASELTALIRHPDVCREIDLMGFSEYLTFAHSIPPRTIVAGIQKLPAGHMAIYQDGNLKISKYWDLRFLQADPKEMGEDLLVERCRSAFERAVKRPLKKGLLTGAFLSGGIDSSSIVAMMSQLGVSKIYTYSAGFRQEASDGELSRARIVAEQFNTRHTELAFSDREYVEGFPRFISFMDEPVADEASLIRMLLAGRARQDVAVILGGEAGDDVTGGYKFDELQKRFDRIRRFQQLPRWLRYSIPALLSPFLPTNLREWLARGNRNIATTNAEEHYSMIWAFEAAEKQRYCPILNGVDDHCHDLVRDVYSRSGTTDPLSQAQYFFTKIWAAEDLMMSAGKMTMSYGLEYHPVFLDHELVELFASIPSRYKVRREPDGSYTIKSIFKQAMRGITPDKVLNLPKSPFQVPAAEWFRGTLAGFCRDVLLPESTRSSNYYDRKQVESLIESHRLSPTVKSMRQIKHLLFFEMWRQLVLAR